MEKKKRIDLNASLKLARVKAKEYNDNLPPGKIKVKQQHRDTLFRVMSLLAEPANQSKYARKIGDAVWPTLETNELALAEQLLQEDTETIHAHFARLEEAGLAKVSKSVAIKKGEYTRCLLSISPDVIAYYA